jgi:predicted small secreted protein
MKKLIIFMALPAFMLCTACNTVKGVGKDVTAVGKAVSKTADEARPK